MGLTHNEERLVSAFERFVTALERIAETYETQVINQSKVIDQTLRTMKMATDFGSDQKPY